jgi:methionyl-tRNA formyltransferase
MDIHSSFVFFGTPNFSIYTLDSLKEAGFLPTLVVTSEDKPVGRHQTMTPSPVKVWALAHNIPVLTPTKIDDNFISELSTFNLELFLVAAYGKILPQKLLDLAKFGTLNVHPSLLPQYRGPAPLEGPILHGDEATGVTIMKIDELVDHGPILRQETIALNGNETTPELGEKLFKRGGQILAEIIPDYVTGEITPIEQDHTLATFTKKIRKEDGLVNLGAELPSVLWQKFRAYYSWPGIYFMDEYAKRVKITDAIFANNIFEIKKVIPEGRHEITYGDWLRGSSLSL